MDLSFLFESKRLLAEANYHHLLKPPVGKLKHASVIVAHKGEEPSFIEYHKSLEDAIHNGDNASAYHNSAYSHNGKKWVKKHSLTEPQSKFNRSGGGGWYGGRNHF